MGHILNKVLKVYLNKKIDFYFVKEKWSTMSGATMQNFFNHLGEILITFKNKKISTLFP